YLSPLSDHLLLGVPKWSVAAMAHNRGRAPRVVAKDLVRALQRAGWERIAQGGGHLHLKHPERGGRVTIPMHARRILKPGTLASILSQAGLTRDELSRLL